VERTGRTERASSDEGLWQKPKRPGKKLIQKKVIGVRSGVT